MYVSPSILPPSLKVLLFLSDAAAQGPAAASRLHFDGPVRGRGGGACGASPADEPRGPGLTAALRFLKPRTFVWHLTPPGRL